MKPYQRIAGMVKNQCVDLAGEWPQDAAIHRVGRAFVASDGRPPPWTTLHRMSDPLGSAYRSQRGVQTTGATSVRRARITFTLSLLNSIRLQRTIEFRGCCPAQ